MSTLVEDPHANIGWHIWVGTITTLVPATFAVAGRFVARYVSRARLWWDDWTILLALAVNWGMAATRWAEVLLYEYGRHANFVPAKKVENFWKSFLAVQITYFSDAVITKISLLLLYYRIFGVVHGFRYSLWAAGAIVAGYFIACLIASIAGCQPVSYFWNKAQPGKCIDEVNFFRWNGITNMLIDVGVLCLPLPMVWRLKTDLRQRLILCGIFLLGGFVCIVSILRIIAFNKSNPKDPTYTTVDTATWSSIEQSMGIVCACLPTMRPLFRHFYGGSKTGTSNTGGASHTRSGTIPLSQMGTERGQTAWRQSIETGSTVGFARLPDETSPSQSTTSAKEAQETIVYSGSKVGVQSSATAGGKDHKAFHVPSRIMLKQEIHQRTDSL